MNRSIQIPELCSCEGHVPGKVKEVVMDFFYKKRRNEIAAPSGRCRQSNGGAMIVSVTIHMYTNVICSLQLMSVSAFTHRWHGVLSFFKREASVSEKISDHRSRCSPEWEHVCSIVSQEKVNALVCCCLVHYHYQHSIRTSIPMWLVGYGRLLFRHESACYLLRLQKKGFTKK